MKHLTDWTSTPNREIVKVEECDHFDARGMVRVYGRGDRFVRRIFNMDIWLARDGRLLVRFWSRDADTDWRSFRILGKDPSRIPRRKPPDGFDDRWIPQAVRDAYDEWIEEEW